MSESVTVVGTGMWGSTLAVLLANKLSPVTLWCRTHDEAEHLKREGNVARKYLDLVIPPALAITSSLSSAFDNCGTVVIAVPAQSMRANCQRIRGHLTESCAILSCTKGLELNTSLRMSQVIAEEILGAGSRLAVLSGPNLAPEVAAGLPATSVIASPNQPLASRLQHMLHTPRFRVYTNADLVGVELAGALKNIVAIGAGLCDGLRLGDNAKAAFIGRGLLEIARLGVAAGAQPLTFAGLAGLGDTIATCSSPLSRNRRVGEQLARGERLPQIQAGLGMVAEGVATTAAARQLAQRYGVEMPIVDMTYAVLSGQKSPQEALVELMTRDLKDEFAGMLS